MHGLGILLALLTASQVRDPLSDLGRFPPHHHAKIMHGIACQRLKAHADQWSIIKLSESATVCRSLESRPWIRDQAVAFYQEMAWEEACWRELMDATNEKERTRGSRAESLDNLKHLLTAEDWAAGQMP